MGQPPLFLSFFVLFFTYLSPFLLFHSLNKDRVSFSIPIFLSCPPSTFSPPLPHFFLLNPLHLLCPSAWFFFLFVLLSSPHFYALCLHSSLISSTSSPLPSSYLSTTPFSLEHFFHLLSLLCLCSFHFPISYHLQHRVTTTPHTTTQTHRYKNSNESRTHHTSRSINRINLRRHCRRRPRRNRTSSSSIDPHGGRRSPSIRHEGRRTVPQPSWTPSPSRGRRRNCKGRNPPCRAPQYP